MASIKKNNSKTSIYGDKIIDFNNLPKEVSISTMTITCKLGTTINLENVSKYIELNLNGIRSIVYGDNIRRLIENKKKKKKDKKKNSFFNQATIEIKPEDNKAINIKLFKNGSVQMTGCKNIENVYYVLDVLLNELKIEKAVIVNGEIIDKTYVDEVDKLKISNLKIVMINSNFSVNYEINREILYKILLKKNIQCVFEPCIHACVNIKYKYDENKIISIFVFQSGSIIITGANKIDHIACAYKYINKILKENLSEIKKNISKNQKSITDYLKQHSLKFKK
jgi:TATA-box binding protein (TBP) (component of TFIID and TFIIIB)